MNLQTKHFGEISVDEKQIIDFNEGILGFENNKKFTIIKDTKDELNIFYWLQSVDDGDVAFVVLNVLPIIPEYDPMVSEEEVLKLGKYIPEDIVFYNIAVIPDDIKNITVNLLAPVVINHKTLKGKQMISANSEYTVRHKIFDKMKEMSI